MIVSLRGSNVDLMHVLFGTVLALNDDALILLCALSSVTLLALAALYRSLVLECVDPQFLRSVSRWSAPVHFAFLGLVGMNLLAGFQALGTLIAVGIMILPAARFWSRGIAAMIGIAVAVVLSFSVAGLLASYHFGLPSGPSIILAAGRAYLCSMVFGPVGSLAVHYLPRHHLEA